MCCGEIDIVNTDIAQRYTHISCKKPPSVNSKGVLVPGNFYMVILPDRRPKAAVRSTIFLFVVLSGFARKAAINAKCREQFATLVLDAAGAACAILPLQVQTQRVEKWCQLTTVFFPACAQKVKKFIRHQLSE